MLIISSILSYISMKENRAQFSTRLGVLATTVGSAVGLGNIWRFPYEAGTNGGGAFMLCYLVFVFIIGVPVMCAEFSMGRSSRSGIPAAYRHHSHNSKWNWAGYTGILAAVLIMAFYSVVAGWTVDYTIDSLGNMYSSSIHDRHSEFTSFVTGWRAELWLVIFLLINGCVILGGVQKGIERVSNILMPFLFLILIAFCVNSLLLPGAGKGLQFLFHPDFSALTPAVILNAMGQAFFSLSLGMGCMITYSSYFKSETPLFKTSVQIAALDTLVAVLAGVIIFPAVFSYGLEATEGPTLVFEVLPSIFAQMAGGPIWSALFFSLLFVASLTSTISVSEIVVTFLCDEWKMKRRNGTLLLTGVSIVLGLLCALSFGPLKWLNLFNIFDFTTSNILLPIGGLASSIFVGWKMRRATFVAEMQANASLPAWLISCIVFSLRWIAPACVLAVFIAGIV